MIFNPKFRYVVKNLYANNYIVYFLLCDIPLNCALLLSVCCITPQKINIEPENDGLEDDFPLPGVYSQVPC